MPWSGGFFGRSALSAQDQVPDQYKVFTAALNAVEDEYVGDVESDRLVYSAITGMLQTLDPHSSFMDPRSYAQMRERQEGRYYGLGITIHVIDGDITVVSRVRGLAGLSEGPAPRRRHRADRGRRHQGLDERPGGAASCAGPKGTPVNISLRRAGYDELIDLRVMRDEIHIPTVPAAFMLDATTGYIGCPDFGENTDQELGRALARPHHSRA